MRLILAAFSAAILSATASAQQNKLFNDYIGSGHLMCRGPELPDRSATMQLIGGAVVPVNHGYVLAINPNGKGGFFAIHYSMTKRNGSWEWGAASSHPALPGLALEPFGHDIQVHVSGWVNPLLGIRPFDPNSIIKSNVNLFFFSKADPEWSAHIEFHLSPGGPNPRNFPARALYYTGGPQNTKPHVDLKLNCELSR